MITNPVKTNTPKQRILPKDSITYGYLINMRECCDISLHSYLPQSLANPSLPLVFVTSVYYRTLLLRRPSFARIQAFLFGGLLTIYVTSDRLGSFLGLRLMSNIRIFILNHQALRIAI